MQSSSHHGRRGRRPLDPLRRTAIACNRCRGRKTKCAGNPPHPCIACEDAKQICTYPESEKRVSVPESYLANLQAHAAATDVERTRSNSDTSPYSPEDVAAETGDDWWFKGMDNLFLSRSGEHHYVGTSSSTYLAKKLNPAPGNLAWEIHPMYNDPSWLRRPPDQALPQLPPYDFAKRLFSAQYIYIGTIFSFLQPQDFDDRLNQIYQQLECQKPLDLSSREACLEFCQILLIFGYGQMYSVNQWSGADGPPGFGYFKHAMRYLPDVHEEGSILFVEVLSLVGYYMQNLNRRDAAFLYIGLALRMAISLGLHQEVSDTSMDIVEREHRRRVWWSVYSMDRILCVKSGNPITIHDEDIDVALPTPMPGRDLDLTTAQVLSHYTQLSTILGRIGQGIYRKNHKTGTGLLSSVQGIMSDLSNWLRDLPEYLKLSVCSTEKHISREAVSVFLHYYQCINMTGRPVLFYVVQRRLDAIAHGTTSPSWRDGLSPGIITIIENLIASARASTSIMSAAASQNEFATYGFMDGEHAFSAALVLAMVNIAFPFNARDASSMETALSVLRAMAEKGNDYIRARYSMLVNINSSIGLQNPLQMTNLAPLASQSVDENSTQDYSLVPEIPAMSTAGVEPTESLPFRNDLPAYQDMSFNFNIDDDPKFWDEVSVNIGIDMDTNWIENTLRREPETAPR